MVMAFNSEACDKETRSKALETKTIFQNHCSRSACGNQGSNTWHGLSGEYCPTLNYATREKTKIDVIDHNYSLCSIVVINGTIVRQAQRNHQGHPIPSTPHPDEAISWIMRGFDLRFLLSDQCTFFIEMWCWSQTMMLCSSTTRLVVKFLFHATSSVEEEYSDRLPCNDGANELCSSCSW